jgi:hypothetical protein
MQKNRFKFEGKHPMTETRINKQSRPHLRIKTPALILLVSLGIMVLFDQMTWNRQFGLQFLLLTMLILIGLLVMAVFEKKRVPPASYGLLVPILLGAVMTAVQKAGSTTLLNILLSLSGLGLMMMTLLNGQWPFYRIREVLGGGLQLAQSALFNPACLLIAQIKAHSSRPAQAKKDTWRKVWSFLGGLLIALPLLFVLGALLASADLIFRTRLSGLFDWLTIENLPELIFRSAYILLLAYLLAGMLIHALTRSGNMKIFDPDEPMITPFLGHIEAFTVLVLVNLLFLGFIIIQIRYFFAGSANISLEGFTFAEYARRGFFELVGVAIISLGLHYLLSMVTKRSDRTNRRVFSALGLLLILQVGTMLLSAFQRLSLYEAAYSFTTLRTLTHVLMIWLGVLLGAAALMEIFNQFRRLALTLILVFFGFTLTLSLLNLDDFIAKRNVEHAIAGHPLDAGYLLWNLSEDGVPRLFAYYQAESTPPEVKETLFAVLACRYANRAMNEDRDFWVERHLSVSRADTLYSANQNDLQSYPFIVQTESVDYLADGQEKTNINNSYFISANGEELWCLTEAAD